MFGARAAADPGTEVDGVVAVMRVVVILLVLWLALAVVGFVVKSLLWLAVVGLVLFVGTAAYGAIRRRNRSAIR